MVKITSSYVNVYTTSDNEIEQMQRHLGNTTNEKSDIPSCQSFNNNDIPTIYESVLNGAQGLMTENMELKQDVQTDENNNQYDSSSCAKIKRNLQSESDIRLLLSPKFKRRMFHTQKDNTIKRQPKNSYTTDHVGLHQENDDCHGDINNNCKAGTTELCVPSERSGFLQSPRIKRKQIDITTSSAYKEIYAHNLRLYSNVLAKQIAATSQVGKEMDDIRRTKIKQKALNPNGRFNRSQSLLDCSRDLPITTKNDASADSDKSLTLPKEKCGPARARSKSEIPILLSKNETVTSRRRAATLRSENIRQKLNSFDMEMDKTSEFLAKLKTSPK